MPDGFSWRHAVRTRLEGLNLTPARESEIVEELSQHLEETCQALIAEGLTEAEAQKKALEELGSNQMLAELRAIEREAQPERIIAGANRGNMLSCFWQDIRFAARTLTKNPAFAALAVLSLGIGIGGNTAMFSVLSEVLLQPLPYPDSSRLVRAVNDGYYPPGGLVALQRASRTMDIAGFNPGVELNLTGQGEALRLTGSSVSANLFSVLGVGAERGRVFRGGDDQGGHDALAILSDGLWKTRFNSDPGVIGRMITLGGVDREVVGVMPPAFAFPDRATQFWIPLHLDPRDPPAYWSRGFMPVIARLRPGATLEQARSEIQSLTHSLVAQFPYSMPKDWNARAAVVPMQQYLVSNVRIRLIVLQLAVGLLLLITCANVANLLLARAASRQKEMAIRTALGASPARIARQLLTESVLLALTGGALGMLLADSTFSLLKLALPGITEWTAIHLSGQALAFAVLVSLVTGLAFGLAPAISAVKDDLAGSIKRSGQRSAGAARTRLRSTLIVSEVALAVVLAVGAGLLIKSLWMLGQVNPGFQPEHLLTLRVSPNQSLCRERAACIGLFDELLRRARDLPGVGEAALANTLPLASNIPAVPVAVEGHPYVPGQSQWPMFWAGAVTPAYFRLMRVPILAGRPLAESDGEKSTPVVVVSAAMARRYWPNENAVGKHIRPVFESRWRIVVGVAGDVRQYDLENHSPNYIDGDMYMPYAQSVTNERQLPSAMTLIVRTNTDTTQLFDRIRELVVNLNPNVPVSEVRTMEALVADSTQQSRSMTWLFASFAGVALLLAAIGTYGVVSYSTSQRTFEIGMRAALGASRRDVFGLVIGQSFRLVVAGLALGIAASLALTRVLRSFLYGTTATDPATLLGVCGVLVLVAALAGYVPARRATRIDPLNALRMD